MNKEKIIKIYYNLNLFIGLGMLASLYVFLGKFPVFMNGEIKRTLFSLDFQFANSHLVEVFNSMLVIFFIVFVVNLGILIYALGSEKVRSALVEGIFYNTILSFILIISHLVFYYQIPTFINGAMESFFFHSNFFELSTEKVRVFNFTYILIIFYLAYNFYINYKLYTGIELIEEKEVK